MGRSSRPTGLRSSEIASVMASPWSPTKKGTTTTMATTSARSIPWGAPLSSIIFPTRTKGGIEVDYYR